MDEEQEEYLKNDTKRTDDLIDVCAGMSDADDKMLEVLERLSQVEVVPDVGRYYTFIYKPKTPRIVMMNTPSLPVRKSIDGDSEV